MRRGRAIFLTLLAAVVVAAMVVDFGTAQTQGPISPGPRRPPGRPPAPSGPGSDAPAEYPGTNLPPVETRPRQPIPEDQPLFTADTNVVNVDVAVVDNRGNFIPQIPKQHFQILEDGVPQQIVSFGPSEAPMTVCLLIEFSNMFQQYWSETWYQTLTAAYGFVETLRPDDWVAVVAYDLKPEILTDFTQDRRKIQEGLQRMRIAGYSESNLFDALTDMCERMKDIEGRKSIVLVSSGLDTFSKLTFGKARRIVQEAGVTVHSIGLMQALREWYDARGYLGPIARLDFLQADNQLRTFSSETGGLSFFPRFYGEFPTIFQTLNYTIRNQYSINYQPTNVKRDGEFREIKVRLVDPETNAELRITDQKGKRVKYKIIAKNGYYAPREVE
jgi:VWFA-related protein